MASLESYLKGLIGQHVRLEQGPEAKEGWVIVVKNDYIGLSDREGRVTYFLVRHLKRILHSLTGNDPGAHATTPPEDPPDSFKACLEQCKGRWVRLGTAGPELQVGAVYQVEDDHLLLVSGSADIVCLPLSHIRNVSVLSKSEQTRSVPKPPPPPRR